MFCIKCGKQLKDDARFCTGCGSPVMAEASVNTPPPQPQYAPPQQPQYAPPPQPQYAPPQQPQYAPPPQQQYASQPQSPFMRSPYGGVTSPKAPMVKLILWCTMALLAFFAVGIFTFNTLVVDDDDKYSFMEEEILETITDALSDGDGFAMAAVFFIEVGLFIATLIVLIVAIVRQLKPNNTYNTASSLMTVSILVAVSNLFRILFVSAWRSAFIKALCDGLDSDSNFVEKIKDNIRDTYTRAPSMFVCMILAIAIAVGLHFLKEYIINNRVDGQRY